MDIHAVAIIISRPIFDAALVPYTDSLILRSLSEKDFENDQKTESSNQARIFPIERAAQSSQRDKIAPNRNPTLKLVYC